MERQSQIGIHLKFDKSKKCSPVPAKKNKPIDVAI